MKEMEIEVHGRVQGIMFRKIIGDFCREHGLKGFVRNKEDGSVNILVQGNKKELEEFLSWINKSPGFSKITGMKYSLRDAGKEYEEFKIVKDKGFIADKARSLINFGKFLIGDGKSEVPNHVAIIPDGNRRWAKEKGYEGSFGHYKAGAYDNIEELFREAKDLGVGYMSIWGFSTENWKRNKKEIEAVFNVVLNGVEKFRKDAQKNKIRFRHIGRKDRLPKNLVLELKKLEEETKDYEDFNVQLCLDYGGRDEIVRAVNKILKSGKKEISEEDFVKNLDSDGIPDPDFIIRTSGENRMSGFMPYQGAYAELYFADVHFPDFGAKELRKAIKEFGDRQRRFGK